MAWELGANFGHLAKLLPIAGQLRQQGHEIFFAVRDTEIAAGILSPKGFAFTQAPVWRGKACLTSPPINFAELLIAEGYTVRNGLAGMVLSWLGLFGCTRPDLIVVDHAPTALLSARIAGLPVVCIDSGFGVPPKVSPLPSIRPWENIADQRLHHAETTVLRSINLISHMFGGRPYERLIDVFAVEGLVFATFAPLDHYGPRPDVDYAGAIFSDVCEHSVQWRGGPRKKVFAYLRPDVPGIGNLLKALSQIDGEVICAIPGLRRIKPELAGPLRIYAHPLKLMALIPEADLVVSYSGSGTVCLSLLAGVPLLLASQNVEQYLLGSRVDGLGAGLSMGMDRSEESFRQSLGQLLGDDRFRLAAEQFASQHKGFHPEYAVSHTVQMIEKVLRIPKFHG